MRDSTYSSSSICICIFICICILNEKFPFKCTHRLLITYSSTLITSYLLSLTKCVWLFYVFNNENSFNLNTILQEPMERAWSPRNLQPIIVGHPDQQSIIIRYQDSQRKQMNVQALCVSFENMIFSLLWQRSFCRVSRWLIWGESKLSLFISLKKNKTYQIPHIFKWI